jgi:RecA/RadA recombinase
MEPPSRGPNGEHKFSETIEQFYFHVDDAIKQAKATDRPFIYVQDSMDFLDSNDDREKFEKQKEAHRKGKEVAGTYGMSKAKKNSTSMRRVLLGLRDTGSILLIISQTRDNVGFGFEKKTRSGGRALRFYATVEIWTSLAGQITKMVRKKKRKIGNKILLKIKKNRVTGGLHEVLSAIYPSHGIDDIGCNVDFLLEESWWSKKGNKVDAKEFKKIAEKEALIAFLEAEPERSRKLAEIVGECWHEIEEASSVKRKPRYQ